MNARSNDPTGPQRVFGPLARRYAVRTCGLTLALLLLSGASEIYFGYRESIRHIQALQAAQATGAAGEITSYVRTIESVLTDAALSPWDHADFDASQARAELHRAMRLAPALVELHLTDAEGRERLYASKADPDRVNAHIMVPDTGPLRARHGAATTLGRCFFREGHLPAVRISVRVGEGTLIATVDLRLLGDVVSRLQVGSGGLAYVVDEQGQLIAHPNPTQVLSRPDLSTHSAVLQARADEGSGPIPVSGLATTNFARVPVIVTVATIPNTRWLLFVEQPRTEALQPVWSTLTRTVLLMTLGGTIAIVLGLTFARRMAAPIVALRQATARIARGDLDTPLQLQRHDEIEDLAQDFNQMAARLRDLYASLEAKVAARTRELSDASEVLEDRAHEIELLNQRLISQLDELSLRKDVAERANAAKSRFLAAASHDLRQPMHSISLLIGVLRTRLNDPVQVDLADKVQSSVTTMENLFGNLLDISKLDAGAVHAHIEDVDLGWLLERAGQTWQPQAQEKGLSLRVRPGRWVVRGDATLLERIVSNLLANAIRYTRSGGVLVGCRRRGEQCELQIWDTGPGIAPEHREAIFEEFFRIGAPGTGQEKGLGLGLSIVRRCVHLLGYAIAVQSREGHGSVFKVLMPLSAGSAATHAPGGVMAAPLAVLEGNFIVVVDDEATNREAVRDALLAAGCHVVTAASADDALAQLESHLRTPDLILTDYQLGDADDGLAVIRRLRAHYDEEVAALVVTANTDARLLADAAALGAALLHKPVGLQRLMAALKEALEAAAP